MTWEKDFIHAIDPDAFAAAVGLELDDWQSRLLDSTSRKVIMLCSRQAGKSTTAALLDSIPKDAAQNECEIFR
jgi:hypothetical protein